MKLVPTFLIAVLMFSKSSYSQQDTSSIKLGFFKKIPKEIGGSSGYYTYDTTSLKSQKYILVTDMFSIGIINVNGKNIYLKVVTNKGIYKNLYKTVFQGNGYSIILTTKRKQVGYDNPIETGTLVIKKGTYTKTVKVHGELQVRKII